MLGNITNMNDVVKSFLTFSVDPWADMIGQVLTGQYGYANWKNGNYFRVDTSTVNHVDIFDMADKIDKLISSAFASIDDSLYEAARIDGCGEFKIMYRIAIPLCVPTIATLCLFYAVGRWNGIDDQLYYVQKTGLHTVQMALKQMIEAVNVQSEESGTTQLVAENIKAASITLSMTPMLVVYPFIQRFFTQGIMLGAVKG
mgnify:CR=1 FL=1